MASLFAFAELSHEARLVWPNLDSKTMLQIRHKLTLILCSISVSVDALSMSYVFAPFSNVHVAIAMLEDPPTCGTIAAPLPMVCSTIRPCLDSKAMPLFAQPLSFIGSSSAEGVFSAMDCTRPTNWQWNIRQPH